MDDLLFVLLPTELIGVILEYTDPVEIFGLLNLFPDEIRKSFLTLVREKMYHHTGLRTNSFDLEKLEEIKMFRYARNIHASICPIVITHKHIYYHYDKMNMFVDNCYSKIIQIQSFQYIRNTIYLFLTSDGYVYKSENESPIIRPENIIPIDEKIISISASHHRGLLLSSQGNVYVFGDVFDYIIRTPEIIPKLKDIVQVATGDSHSLALSSNGRVYSFGGNNVGQLGNGYIPRETPKIIPGIYNVVQISCGRNHSLVLTTNGEVYAFGCNRQYQLGSYKHRNLKAVYDHIYITNNIVSISAIQNYSLFLSKDGTVYGCGNDRDKLLSIPLLENIIQISTNEHYSLALDSDGIVHKFGISFYDDSLCIPISIYKMDL